MGFNYSLFICLNIWPEFAAPGRQQCLRTGGHLARPARAFRWNSVWSWTPLVALGHEGPAGVSAAGRGAASRGPRPCCPVSPRAPRPLRPRVALAERALGRFRPSHPPKTLLFKKVAFDQSSHCSAPRALLGSDATAPPLQAAPALPGGHAASLSWRHSCPHARPTPVTESSADGGVHLTLAN